MKMVISTESGHKKLISLIQEASAGTGKTFALSSRYLQLIFLNVDPASILATTFTRAAAGEILDRIMTRLARAANSDEAAKRLGGEIGMEINRNDAINALVRLVRQIHRLNIGTIDSFFFRIAQACTTELNLPVGWQLTEEDQYSRGVTVAVQKVLGEQGSDQLLHMWSRHDANRSVASSLEKMIDSHYSVFQQSDESAWSSDGPVLPLVEDEHLNRLAERLESLSTTGRLRKAIVTDAGTIRSGNLAEVAKKTIAKNVLNGNCTYYNAALPEDVVEAYQTVNELITRHFVSLNRIRNEAAYGLLKRFARHFRQWQIENGLQGFDDVSRLLGVLMSTRPPALDFRIENGIQHLMLDEFQDTSPQQWAVLKWFVEKATGEGGNGSFFCVGDPKQAIFGWRGGVAGIFDVVRKDLQDRLGQVEPLVTSRRSAPVVIDAVNQVFARLDRVVTDSADVQQVFSEWMARFPVHTTVHRFDGSVRLLQTEKGGRKAGLDPVEEIDKVVVETIRRLEKSSARSIGVLLRRHEDVARLIFRLRDAGISCSEEGGNPLTDSAAVNVILSALRLADHPEDSISGFAVANSRLGEVLQIPPPGQPSEGKFQKNRHRVGAMIRQRLYDEGYGATCLWLAQPLFDNGTLRERTRMEMLVNLATEFDLQWSPRAMDFVRIIETRRVTDPTSARVRIMTVHRSKGLEFDAVVAPMYGLANKWTASNPSMVYSRDPDTREINRICRYVGADHRPYLPKELQHVFSEYHQTQIRESLCLLYVLLTRAVHDLTLIVDGDRTTTSEGIEGILMATLAEKGHDEAEQQDGAFVVFARGNRDWKKPDTNNGGSAGRTDFKLEERPDNLFVKSSPLRWPETTSKSGRGMSWISPSRYFASDRTNAKTLLDLDALRQARGERDGKAFSRQFGTAIHAILQSIEWLDGEDRTPIWKKIAARYANEPTVESIARAATRSLGLPVMKSIFQRNEYIDHIQRHLIGATRTLIEPLSLEVRNESPIVATVDGHVVEGIIDRMIMIREGTRLISIEIIEFKTDDIPAEAAGSRTRIHTPQIQLYRHAVAGWSGLNCTDVHARLVFAVPGVEVVIGD